MTADEPRLRAARNLAEFLALARLRLVLAESCTAGNVSGTLAIIPGISAWLCGSLVVYRNESKTQWLHIPRGLLDDPEVGPVSRHVTELLAQQALSATPEADIGVAVTGHIGPGSPVHLDGRAFFAIARRGAASVESRQRQLGAPPPRDSYDLVARENRLAECTCWVLEQTLERLSSGSADMPRGN